jgi:hypothetical protein
MRLFHKRTFLATFLGFIVNEPPVEEGIVYKGLQHRHQGVLVPPQHLPQRIKNARKVYAESYKKIIISLEELYRTGFL